MRAPRTIALILGAALISAAGISLAKKKKPKPDRGTIVFGKGKSIWKAPATGGDAVEIAALGFRAKRIQAIKSNAKNTVLLISTDENHYWVQPSSAAKGELAVVRHVCRGSASMSLDGMTVLCQKSDGAISLESMGAGGKKTELTVTGKLATLAGNNTQEVVVANSNGIEALSTVKKGKTRTLGVLAPASDLLVAPNGKSAVAVFPESAGGTGLYSFLFDGKGVRRKLVTEAVPVAWSADSTWLVLTRKKRGCVVRAAGGQYRCFDGFRALGISPDLKDALLVSGKKSSLTLFRADLGGARSAKPVVMRKNVHGAAVWLAP